VEQLVVLIDILNLFSSIQFILRDSSGEKKLSVGRQKVIMSVFVNDYV
jgi:hypothetical protein